jgi:hypothetical protein
MLVACRLAGLSALETDYAGARVGAQCGPIRFSPHSPHSKLAKAWSLDRDVGRILTMGTRLLLRMKAAHSVATGARNCSGRSAWRPASNHHRNRLASARVVDRVRRFRTNVQQDDGGGRRTGAWTLRERQPRLFVKGEDDRPPVDRARPSVRLREGRGFSFFQGYQQCRPYRCRGSRARAGTRR